ncbi:MAG TPA: alpha/beta hydrolase [Marmoricola sp.]|nr:alpha/beta hydrolase [Marmoricola sp.]
MQQRVTFASSSGPMLAGIIDMPEGEIRGWGVWSHGLTLGKDSPATARVCKQLAAEGIGMLRFDNLGLGDSEGDWADGSFSHKVADTVLACTFMRDRGTTAQLLGGHSFGGAAVLSAAKDVPEIKAVVTVGAPSEPSHAESNYDSIVAEVLKDGSAPWMIGGKHLTLKRSFIEDVRAANIYECVHTLHRPLLIMHSPTDNTVGIDNASEIFRMAKHPRSFIALEGADHFLTGKGQAARAAHIISAWVDVYLS